MCEIISEPRKLTRWEAWVAEQKGDPESHFQIITFRQCMACMHTFEPETAADSSCPYCGGPSEGDETHVYLHEVEAPEAAQAIPADPYGELCPMCEGKSAEVWRGHPANQPHCPTCEDEGTLRLYTADEAGHRLCTCGLCGEDVEATEGLLVGVVSDEGGDGSFACPACLDDPEHVHQLIGVTRLGQPPRNRVRPEPAI